MNDHPKPTPALRLINRLQEIEIENERPPDRELRRLRGLSAEVGAACTTWLTARGIKARTWGPFDLQSSRSSRTKFGFYPDHSS
jgi:hypothetical protein